MQFGKKYYVGNFFVFKYNKVLRKSEVAELRNQMGIPMDERKKLQRAQLPYIKVEAVSGIWSVEFCCSTVMYNLIDRWLAADDEELKTSLFHIFSMMFTDTTIMGDTDYLCDKAKALKAFTDRQKAVETSQEDDDKILDELKADEDARSTIVDMANQIRKEDGNG